MRFHPLTPLTALSAAFLLAVLAPAVLYAQPAGGAALSGTLVNGTDGGDMPGGIAVLLHIFGAAAGAVDTYETITDADGVFRFDDVPAPDAGGSAAIVAVYGGTRYSRTVAAADFANPVTLTVYEPTQDVGVVSTAEQSIIIAGVDRADRRLAALQLFTLENRSDTTLVPDLSAPPMLGQFSFLRFSLPPEASGLDVSTDLVGGEVIPVGTGFAITAPVPPGRHTVSFTYAAPYADDTLAWRDNTLQGAESLRLLIPAELGNIGVGGLPPADLLTLGDISYRVWRATEIAPGAGVNITLSGLPEPTLLTRLGNPLTEVRFWYAALPALVAAALAGLLGWGVIRRRPANSGGAV